MRELATTPFFRHESWNVPEAALLLDNPYARSLCRFGRTVTLRYRTLLSELSASPADAHSQIVAAMISGELAPLEAWLDTRHGPAASPGCSAPRLPARSPDWSGDAAPGGQAAQCRTGPPGDQQA